MTRRPFAHPSAFSTFLRTHTQALGRPRVRMVSSRPSRSRNRRGSGPPANLETTFTGPLARSLALVAIVIGGLMFMFGEGGAKRQISGIVFGGGLALFAAQFLTWLF